MTDLVTKHCTPCESGKEPMSKAEAVELLKSVDQWELNTDGTSINRSYHFKNYYQTIAFTNALAWVAHQEDHHPSLTITYKKCDVIYNTHAVNGLSENDFICAAKIDALIV